MTLPFKERQDFEECGFKNQEDRITYHIKSINSYFDFSFLKKYFPKVSSAIHKDLSFNDVLEWFLFLIGVEPNQQNIDTAKKLYFQKYKIGCK